MDTDSGYETSLLLCQVEMGFDTDKEFTASSLNEDKSPGKESLSSVPSIGDKSSPVVKVHKCDYPGCDAKFDRPWKLSAHRCIHTGERPYKCRYEGCTKSYTNLTHVRRHEQANHIGKQAVASDGAPVPAATFTCDSPGCGNTFQSKCSLKRHFIKKHQDAVKCPDCDMVFQKHNQLKTHMFTHDGIKPFKCDWCNSSFVNHSDVMSHIKKHKLYRCSYMDCPEGSDKVYTNRNELRSHLALIHPSKYSCENCNKTFTLKCRLTSHKLSCGSDKNDKQYKCIMEECTHVFKLHRNMLQHVKHKHGEPRFACEVENCGKKFIWKISYNKHVKTYHEPRQMEPYLYYTEETQTQRIPKQKKQRKDANIPKYLVAEMLSGVCLDKDTQMMLLNKQRVDVDEALMQATVGLAYNDYAENKYDSEGSADVEPTSFISIKQEMINEDTTGDGEEFSSQVDVKLNSPPPAPTPKENDCDNLLVNAQTKPNSPEFCHSEHDLPVRTIPNSSTFSLLPNFHTKYGFTAKTESDNSMPNSPKFSLVEQNLKVNAEYNFSDHENL